MKNIVLNKEIEVIEGKVISRPSKIIKTPYVCDLLIKINELEEKTVLAHTPSLGCNGMVDKDANVIAVKRDSGKCEYTVICSKCEEKGRKYLVGVEPSLAEKFAKDILINGRIKELQIKPEFLKTQQTYEDCRFDYCGLTTNNEPFICEIKNVSISVYENKNPKILSKMNFDEREYNSKIAIFPSGYKPKGKTHSERALKHTNTLTKIKKIKPEVRCIILFIIQRDDVESFEPSNGDLIYSEALKEAKKNNVEIYAVSINWKEVKTNEIISTISQKYIKVNI